MTRRHVLTGAAALCLPRRRGRVPPPRARRGAGQRIVPGRRRSPSRHAGQHALAAERGRARGHRATSARRGRRHPLPPRVLGVRLVPSGDAGPSDPAYIASRNEATAWLTDVVQGDDDPARRSRAANLLGTLSFSDAISDYENRGAAHERGRALVRRSRSTPGTPRRSSTSRRRSRARAAGPRRVGRGRTRRQAGSGPAGVAPATPAAGTGVHDVAHRPPRPRKRTPSGSSATGVARAESGHATDMSIEFLSPSPGSSPSGRPARGVRRRPDARSPGGARSASRTAAPCARLVPLAALVAAAACLGLAAMQPVASLEETRRAHRCRGARRPRHHAVDARERDAAHLADGPCEGGGDRAPREAPTVPVGLASLTDRTLPHLFPSATARCSGDAREGDQSSGPAGAHLLRTA
jgi:hypothetical protein